MATRGRAESCPSLIRSWYGRKRFSFAAERQGRSAEDEVEIRSNLSDGSPTSQDRGASQLFDGSLIVRAEDIEELEGSNQGRAPRPAGTVFHLHRDPLATSEKGGAEEALRADLYHDTRNSLHDAGADPAAPGNDIRLSGHASDDALRFRRKRSEVPGPGQTGIHRGHR